MEDIRKDLRDKGKALGIKITEEQAEQFQTYMELLLEWNEKMNLTAITQPGEMVEKHFLDSLTLLLACKVKEGAKVVDVGTGAGFPGIPLKILRPDVELTLLDSLNKRLTFLGRSAPPWGWRAAGCTSGRRRPGWTRPCGRVSTWPWPGRWRP